jgi:hypothetical protein
MRNMGIVGSANLKEEPTTVSDQPLISVRVCDAGYSEQCPHDGKRDHEYENGEGNEYTHRIFHREFAAYGVEAAASHMVSSRFPLTVGFAVLLPVRNPFQSSYFVLTLRNFDPDSHHSSHHPCSPRWKRAFCD